LGVTLLVVEAFPTVEVTLTSTLIFADLDFT